MMYTPPKAAKRHFTVQELTGWDAFWWPRALRLRVIAIKILRHYGDVPRTWSVWRALFAKPKEVKDCSFSIGMGGTYLVTNTRGNVERA